MRGRALLVKVPCRANKTVKARFGTYKTVKARFGTYKTVKPRCWPWLAGKSARNVLRCSLFARNRDDLLAKVAALPPALRMSSNRLFLLPRFIPHVAGFRRAPVQIKDLYGAIWSYSEGWWLLKTTVMLRGDLLSPRSQL